MSAMRQSRGSVPGRTAPKAAAKMKEQVSFRFLFLLRCSVLLHSVFLRAAGHENCRPAYYVKLYIHRLAKGEKRNGKI